jgi:hypothetical protein
LTTDTESDTLLHSSHCFHSRCDQETKGKKGGKPGIEKITRRLGSDLDVVLDKLLHGSDAAVLRLVLDRLATLDHIDGGERLGVVAGRDKVPVLIAAVLVDLSGAERLGKLLELQEFWPKSEKTFQTPMVANKVLTSGSSFWQNWHQGAYTTTTASSPPLVSFSASGLESSATCRQTGEVRHAI